MAFDSTKGTERGMFCNPTAYCSPYVYFIYLVIHMVKTTKALHPGLSNVRLTLSVLIACLVRKGLQGRRSGLENVNLVLFCDASHMTSSAPQSLLDIPVFLGQLLRLQTTQSITTPMSEHIYVLLELYCGCFFGGKSCTRPVHFSLRACV